jgi:tetratricopeptide (TPR) repeat protein
MADLALAKVVCRHTPIDHDGLRREADVIGHASVSRDELVGFLEYLKHTDFPAYANEIGTSVEELISQSQAAYRAGCALSDAKEFSQAIQKYSEAIVAFPQFYEAYDNRSFALMDLGRYKEAAAGFGESLAIAPDNPIAMFSLGECYLRLGESAEALRVFRECVARWPDRPHHHEFLKLAQKQAGSPVTEASAKPWWRFW